MPKMDCSLEGEPTTDGELARHRRLLINRVGHGDTHLLVRSLRALLARLDAAEARLARHDAATATFIEALENLPTPDELDQEIATGVPFGERRRPQ